ncbi:MAG: hypothetical protein RID53_33030, partial [Coleofasciculus sp. B1-GNL1-01]|uniref:hypothetical protein n=1 Tax=Coleofasciculus sp. B1-GNL1-01 TaxID=3068484 RepID=UPI0032F1B158
ASWNFCQPQRRIFPRQRVETIAHETPSVLPSGVEVSRGVAYCLLPLPTTRVIQQTLVIQ